MGRGASRAAGHGGGGGGGATNIEDMISARNDSNKQQVDDVLAVADVMTKKYGKDVAIEGTFQVGDMKGRTLAYYDHDGNICMNRKYINNTNLDDAYDSCVEVGFHPSRGKKSGTYATAAHEYGHSLTENVRKKMGNNVTFDGAATQIVTEARKTTKHRGNIKFGESISGYAKKSDAETVAEAVSDVFCNGKKAKKESHAVVDVIDKYLLGNKKKKK